LKRRDSDLAEYLGYLAGALTTLCYIPQIMRVFRLKSAKEISIPFTLMLLIGVLLWLLYGIFAALAPVIVWNSIGFMIALVLLYSKLKYGR
jgi:MtN3 and saliva related transmembrane protein